MPRTQFAALVLATTTLATAGCGGSSKTSSPTTTASANSTATTTNAATAHRAVGPVLTRAELIAKGDTICARANAKTIVLQAESIKALARIYPQVAVYNREEAAKLSALVPPASLASDWSRMIQDLEQHSRYVNEVAHDIDIHDEHAASRPYSQANTAISDLIETGKRDGFAHCSHLS